MKKIIYFLTVITVVFFASCGSVIESNKKIGPGIDTTLNSACYYNYPVLAPRYDCSGKALSQPKVIGWETKTCSTVNHISFNEAYLNDRGYQYVGKPVNVGPINNPSDKVSNHFGDFPWEWLSGLAFTVFLIIMLTKLAKTPITSTTPVVKSSESTSSQNNQSFSISFIERANALGVVIKSMNENGMEGEFNLGEGVNGKLTLKGDRKKSESGHKNPS